MKQSLFIFLCLFLTKGFSQENLKYSIKANSNYIYYFINTDKYISVDMKNFFNYGFSILLAMDINDKIKLSSGVNYNTKNIYYEDIPTNFNNYFIKEAISLKNINIPVLLSYTLHKTESNSIYLTGGIVINNIVKYDMARYFSVGETKFYKNINVGQKTGYSFRAGFELNYRINSKLDFSIHPYLDYKFILDFNTFNSLPESLTEDRFSFGINVGVEYHFLR